MNHQQSDKKHAASNPFFGFLGATKDAKTASTLQGHLVAMSGEFVGTFMYANQRLGCLSHASAFTTLLILLRLY